MTFDVEVISGSIRAGLGYNATGVEVEVSGSHVFIGEASQTSDEGVMIRTRTSDFIGSIDNVSVQKVIQEPNKRYITDEGKSPKYPLVLYSGSGKKFNGTNQYVEIDTLFNFNNFLTIGFIYDIHTIPSISHFCDFEGAVGRLSYYQNTIQIYDGNGYVPLSKEIPLKGTILSQADLVNGIWTVHIDGVLFDSVTISPFSILDKDLEIARRQNGDQYFNTTLKDLYIFNRALTEQEITKNYEQPEQFYIDALADATCVLNMPMCDTDTNVRDMANYSEGSELIINSGFDTSNVDNWLENPVIIENSELKVEIASTSSKLKYPLSGLEIGEYYIWTFDVRAESDSFPLRVGGFDYVNGGGESVFPRLNYFINTSTRTITRIGKATTSTVTLMPHRDNQLGTYYIDNFSFKKLSGIHPFINHSTDTNVNNLQYGTQNLKLPMDSLGKRDGVITPYIKGDGVSYGDTGWIPPSDSNWSIEIVFDISDNGSNRWQGTDNIQIGERYNTTGKARIVVGGSYIVSSYIGISFVHLILSKSGNNYIGYLDGIAFGNIIATPINNTPFVLEAYRTDIIYNFENRLFKVHDKALTQEEVTTAYNDAVNKGLLA